MTRQLGNSILPGVTRAALVERIQGLQLDFLERPFTIAEALAAAEAFQTSATGTVMPVVRLDGHSIGDGRPGPITRMLREVFHQNAEIHLD